MMAFSLEDAFREFCSFGDKDSAPLMDGSKFAKMCRDSKLLDKKLTATDVDIIFAKAKPKTERKLTMAQFEVAVDMMGEKKYPRDPRASSKIRSKLTSGTGPSTHPGATTVVTDQVLDRMTDTSKYTGSHKHRFDETGKGKGLEGRDMVSKGPGYIPPLVSAQPSYVTGNLIGLDAVDSARARESPKAKAKAGAATSGSTRSSSRPSGPKSTAAAAKSSPRGQSKVASTAAKASPKVPAQSKVRSASSPKASPKAKPKGDIYDRLTDTSGYTGSHKHRFDETGRGKGVQGRDAPAKGAAMTPAPTSNLTSYVSGYKHENTYGRK